MKKKDNRNTKLLRNMEFTGGKMDQEINVLKKYLLWSKERFPPAGALLYAGGLFCVSYLFGYLINNNNTIDLARAIAGFTIVFLVLFHLRIFDEHKDFEDDKLAHPDRLLSQGIITLKDLRKPMYMALLLECFLAIYLGQQQFVIWLLILAWSLLMLKEFFAPDFIKKHTVLYLVSHQLLIPIIFIFCMSLSIDLYALQRDFPVPFYIFLAGGTCLTITYEISRKTCSEEQEHEHADSYTKVWGTNKTIIINLLAAALCSASFIYIYITLKLSYIYSITALLLYIIFLITELLFKQSPSKKSSKIVEAGGIIFMLGIFIISSTGFLK